MKTLLIIITAVLSLTAIATSASKDVATSTTTEGKPAPKHKKTVHVYYFKGFNKAIGEKTIKALKQTFDSVAFEGEISFPDSAYYAPRNRYKADKLIKHLKRQQASPTDLVVGFSPMDISARVHNYDDFGVMGLTFPSLHCSVVSTHRLANNSRLQSDFVKLVLHELGHADGLPHCKNSSSCYMRDANKRNHFPELDGFCNKCKQHLTKRGWRLK